MREKLIEILRTSCAVGKDCHKNCIECTADHLISNGVTIQKWIPVTERLPEPYENVLCWYEYFRFGSYNRMFQTYGIGYYFRDGFWGGEVSNGYQAKVLAWMPLPEPPKE